MYLPVGKAWKNDGMFLEKSWRPSLSKCLFEVHEKKRKKSNITITVILFNVTFYVFHISDLN